MSCPRLGRECNEFMCGSCIGGICQESETHCDFCNGIESELNATHPINRKGFINCITYDNINNIFCIWHKCDDDYYTCNIKFNYCPVCGRKLKYA
jgi:hypothetical protein